MLFRIVTVLTIGLVGSFIYLLVYALEPEQRKSEPTPYNRGDLDGA